MDKTCRLMSEIKILNCRTSYECKLHAAISIYREVFQKLACCGAILFMRELTHHRKINLIQSEVTEFVYVNPTLKTVSFK